MSSPEKPRAPKGNKLLRSALTAILLSVVAAGGAADAMAQETVTGDQRARLEKLIKSGEITGPEMEKFIKENLPAGEAIKALKLSPEAQQKLLGVLEARFNGPKLYESKDAELTQKKVTFADVKKALEKDPAKMWSLARMEETGGAPSLVEVTETELVFADVSAESPEGRRDLTYDQAKKMADEMGVEMMSPDMYRKLQGKMKLDSKTWSRLLTADPELLKSGSALHGYRRGADVVVYGYIAVYRSPDGGWRGLLRVQRP